MQVSIWEKESFYADKDVIIIGSGFTGLWSAYELLKKNEKLKVAIVERGVIPEGASTRNAGFSCFGSPTELIFDAATMGEDSMWQLVEMRFKGLEKIRQHFSASALDYDPCGGYECLDKDSEEADACRDKMDWLNEGLFRITGKEKVFSWQDQDLQRLGLSGFGHLIWNPMEAGLHSGKYVQALAHKVQSMGAELFYGLEITRCEEGVNNVAVYTKQAVAFRAQQVLYCTNAFTSSLLPGTDVVPARGQVLVTSPIEGLRLKGTFHYDEGFYYFRNLGNRVLLGGARNKAFEEERTEDLSTTSIIQDELERFLKQHILCDQAYSIEYRWAGTMGMGTVKKPLIQQLSNRTYCCVRMSGMGVALAPLAAEQIVSLMEI